VALSIHIPASRVQLVDAAVLDGRALALERDSGSEPETRLRQLASFRLGPAECATEILAIARAVVRLGEVLPIAGTAPVFRGIAFVENFPVPVVDLASLGRTVPRPLSALAAGPALMVEKGPRRVAVAVEGPLDLLEEELSEGAGSQAGPGVVRFAGATRSGALVVSSEWLSQWVADL
jgi:hypothetical protein